VGSDGATYRCRQLDRRAQARSSSLTPEQLLIRFKEWWRLLDGHLIEEIAQTALV
jgi:hypothetical protein